MEGPLQLHKCVWFTDKSIGAKILEIYLIVARPLYFLFFVCLIVLCDHLTGSEQAWRLQADESLGSQENGWILQEPFYGTHCV